MTVTQVFFRITSLFITLPFLSVAQSPLPETVALEQLALTNPDSAWNLLKQESEQVFLAGTCTNIAALERYFVASKALFVLGEIDKSHQYSLRGRLMARQLSAPYWEGKFTGQLGYRYFVHAVYDSAAVYFSESMRIFSAIPDSVEYHKSVVNWAQAVFAVSPEIPASRWAVRKAVTFYQKTAPSVPYATSLLNAATIYVGQNLRDSARYYFAEVERVADFLPVHQKPQLWLNLGVFSEEDGNLPLALDYYNRAWTLQSANPRIAASVGNNRGMLLKKMGKWDEAEQSFLSALNALPDPHSFRDLRQRALDELTGVYEHQGRWKEALQTYRSAIALADSIHGAEVRIAIDELSQKYHASEQQRIIERQADALRLRNSLLWAALVVVLLLAYAYYKHQKALRAERAMRAMLSEKNEALVTANEELSRIVKDTTHQPEDVLSQMFTLTDRAKTTFPLRDILYIEADTNEVVYYTTHGKYTNWQSLSKCAELLPASHFVRISRRHIVARHAVGSKSANSIRLISGQELSVGGGKYRDAMDLL